MEMHQLGRTGLQVSRVAYGGIISMDVGQENSDRYVAYAVEQGVNYFDVAPTYGDAQQRLGVSLKPYRSGVSLACKTQHRDAEGAKGELLESLKMLQTDHFDVYQMHAMATPEDVAQAFGKNGAIETFVWAKKEGLIRNIGISTHNEDIVLKALDLFDFDTVLFPMNWAMGINRGWGDRVSELAKKRRFGLLAMKTMVHRKWREGEAHTYPKSWCKPVENEKLAVAGIKYGLYKGADLLIPPGDFEHFTFLLNHIGECLGQPLTDEEWAMLKTEAEAVRNETIF